MMLTWLRRLLRQPTTPAPRLVALQNQVDDVESRVDWLAGELKRLRGRVTGAERKRESPEDAPGETIEEQPAPRHHPPPTAHLARRFRSF
jgi:hypothetical protein